MAALPLHKRQKVMAAHLSETLSAQYKRRSLPIRKGDRVKIMRGTNAGKEGKVTAVNLKDYTICVEGIVRKKPDGKEYPIPLQHSKVMITELELSDERRTKAISRTVKG